MSKKILSVACTGWVICILFLILNESHHCRHSPLFQNTITSHGEESQTRRSLPDQHTFLCDSAYNQMLELDSNDTIHSYRNELFRIYCKILPVPRVHPNAGAMYAERDIAFVIFTGRPFYRNRASSLYDTWISRTRKYYFLSATPDQYLPVTVVEGAGEDKLSNMKKLFYGLQIIYKEQIELEPNDRQKWFFIIGCDTFVFSPHLITRLNGYNYTEPLLIGSNIGKEKCPGDGNTTFSISFPSGGAGFFLSFKLLEMMQPHLRNYVEHEWFTGSILSDVALACLAFQLGVNLTDSSGFWRDTPIKTLKEHGYNNLQNDSEINTFHYISSKEMYVLDEYFVLQHVDYLIRGMEIKSLEKFIINFIVAHYRMMRMKKQRDNLSLSINRTTR